MKKLEVALDEQAVFRSKDVDARDQKILRLRRLEVTTSKIAKQVDCGEATVLRVLQKNGLDSYRERGPSSDSAMRS